MSTTEKELTLQQRVKELIDEIAIQGKHIGEYLYRIKELESKVAELEKALHNQPIAEKIYEQSREILALEAKVEELEQSVAYGERNTCDQQKHRMSAERKVQELEAKVKELEADRDSEQRWAKQRFDELEAFKAKVLGSRRAALDSNGTWLFTNDLRSGDYFAVPCEAVEEKLSTPVSNCCHVHVDTDRLICQKCGEHCGAMEGAAEPDLDDLVSQITPENVHGEVKL